MNCDYCGIPYLQSPTPLFCSHRCRCLRNADLARPTTRLPYKED